MHKIMYKTNLHIIPLTLIHIQYTPLQLKFQHFSADISEYFVNYLMQFYMPELTKNKMNGISF